MNLADRKKVVVTLPRFDSNMPEDGFIPDLTGLPVTVDDEPVGIVVDMRGENYGGRVRCLIDVPAELVGESMFGLNARVRARFVGPPGEVKQVVEHIHAVDSIGAYLPVDGERLGH